MGWERRGLRHLLISQTPLSLSTRLSTRLPPSSLYLLASIFSLPPHAGWVISTFSLCRLQSDQNPPGPPLCRLRPDPPQCAATKNERTNEQSLLESRRKPTPRSIADHQRTKAALTASTGNCR